MNTNKLKLRPILFLIGILVLTIFMLLYPQAAYQGACNGLNTWITHLLPALLPFFIVANLLIALGFVQFLGVLLEPIMRPVFRLPGEAGFALALGFTSGFPMGAVLTASLKEQNLCTENEAARLAAFTNNSSPLFLLIAVPISMLHAPQLGILLLFAHYAANLTIGVLLRFTAVKTNSRPFHEKQNIVHRAITTLIQHHRTTPLYIGTLLGQAIQKGLSSIINIGGFVLFFSVLLSLLQASGLFIILQSFFQPILQIFQMSPHLSDALSAGLFEMTLGAQYTAQCETDLLSKLMIISFILGWSGLSIQAQVCSILSAQQIPTTLYCLCRPLQGLLAALYIPLFIKLFPWILSVATTAPFQGLNGKLTITSPFLLWIVPMAFSAILLVTLLTLSGCMVLLQMTHNK